MGSHELSENQKRLFEYISEGNINEVKNLLNNHKFSVNCCDDQGMTPLHHAAFKGQYEICKLLLDCGADVNNNEHIYGYSVLCLAALSNHCDVVSLLLKNGANVDAINSNKRTASQMAAFVGSHQAVNIINSYIPKDAINYFTEIHGLEKEPKLPLFLSDLVHKLVIMPNIHPVRIVLYLQSNNVILQNIRKVIDVLNLLSEKQLKEMANDRSSIKLHHIAFVLSTVSDYMSQNKKSGDEEIISDNKNLDLLMKSWLKGVDNAGISLNLEKFLRKSISAYPFRDCLLYQQIVTTVSATALGNEPNAFSILSNAIVGQYSNNVECCATCGDQSASSKQCSACKNVQYCDKICQKLHWFLHKNVCKKP